MNVLNPCVYSTKENRKKEDGTKCSYIHAHAFGMRSLQYISRISTWPHYHRVNVMGPAMVIIALTGVMKEYYRQ